MTATANQHAYYDHESKGDPISDLRDALKMRGWDVVLAHTGGGCMAVEVVGLRDGLSALVGIDQPIDEAGCGGADLENQADRDDPYVGSAWLEFEAGRSVDTVEAWLRDLRLTEPGQKAITLADLGEGTYVSGDWMVGDGSLYVIAYAANLGAPWNGFATPLVTRGVAEQIVADQPGDVEGFEGIDVLRFDGDTLVRSAMDDGELVEQQRVDPVDGLYDVGFGWCWDEVELSECLNVIHSDGTRRGIECRDDDEFEAGFRCPMCRSLNVTTWNAEAELETATADQYRCDDCKRGGSIVAWHERHVEILPDPLPAEEV